MRHTPRELFHRIMRFECPGRTLATLGGMWPSTLQRWVSEGMPPELTCPSELCAHFGLCDHGWARPKGQLFVWPEFERTVVREDEDTVTYVHPHGIVCTEFKTDAFKSMPHFESFPVKTRADWHEFRRRLVWDAARLGHEWEQQKAGLRQQQEQGVPLLLSLGHTGSLYGSLRDLVGVETLSMLFYDDPAWVHEMMDAVVELFSGMVTALFSDFTPDGVCLWEDMAFRGGSLLAPRFVREFMLPRCQVMTAALRRQNIPIILLDSDGDIGELIPIWLEAGIDGVVPMEAQAGMDVARYRRLHPRLLMMGGVDKKALASGRQAIDREMAKIAATIASGGYVPFFDHGLPHDVSYENFLYYIEQLKHVTGWQS